MKLNQQNITIIYIIAAGPSIMLVIQEYILHFKTKCVLASCMLYLYPRL